MCLEGGGIFTCTDSSGLRELVADETQGLKRAGQKSNRKNEVPADLGDHNYLNLS